MDEIDKAQQKAIENLDALAKENHKTDAIQQNQIDRMRWIQNAMLALTALSSLAQIWEAITVHARLR